MCSHGPPCKSCGLSPQGILATCRSCNPCSLFRDPLAPYPDEIIMAVLDRIIFYSGVTQIFHNVDLAALGKWRRRKSKTSTDQFGYVTQLVHWIRRCWHRRLLRSQRATSHAARRESLRQRRRATRQVSKPVRPVRAAADTTRPGICKAQAVPPSHPASSRATSNRLAKAICEYVRHALTLPIPFAIIVDLRSWSAWKIPFPLAPWPANRSKRDWPPVVRTDVGSGRA